jgi:hypothetical protein
MNLTYSTTAPCKREMSLYQPAFSASRAHPSAVMAKER